MALTPLEPGDPQRVGAYLLAGRLGAGGQGVVYEGYDDAGGRAAVKVLYGGGSGLGKELAAASRVSSFCTARILSSDPDAEHPYLVSEYIEGPTLRRAVQESGPFEADRLHRLATAVATALAAIHAAGVVHRDLKPDNILLGPDGPRVIDFGLARVTDLSATFSEQIQGTPIYMSPEAFSDPQPRPPHDVWAWGAIVLYAATGEHPFRADTIHAVMARILAGAPDTSVLAQPLRDLVTAALSLDETDRPTAHDVLVGLIGGRDGATLAAGSRVGAGLTSPVPVDEPALGVQADEIHDALDVADRDLTAGLFLRLISTDTDHDEVLRRASRDELLAACDGREQLLAAYLGAGLLATDNDTVRIAHPALLRAWPRLRGWIDAERDGLPVHRQLTIAARSWDEHGRKDGDLLHGARLEATLRWAATGRRHLRFTPLESRFLDAGSGMARRQSLRRRIVNVVLALLTVLAVTGAGVSALQYKSATNSRDLAAARSVAARADTLRATDPVNAQLLNVAAWRLADIPETRAGLYSALAQRERAVFTDPESRANDVVRLLSPDGRKLIRASSHDIMVWDVDTGAKLAETRIDMPGTRWAAISPTGKYLVIASRRNIKVWDFPALRPSPVDIHIDYEGPFEDITGGDTYEISFKGADRYLSIDDEGGTLYDLENGQRVPGTSKWAIYTIDPTGTIAVTESHNSSRLALRNIRTKKTIGLPGEMATRCATGCIQGTAAFSDDGELLAVRRNSAVLVFKFATGKLLATLGGAGSIKALRFSPDHRLLTAVTDGVQVWDIAAEVGYPVYRPAASRPVEQSPAFTNGLLRYLTRTGAVLSLDLTGHAVTPSRDGEGILSRDSRMLVKFVLDSPVVEVWDTLTNTMNNRFEVPGVVASSIPDLSGDGSTLAIATDKRIEIRALPSGAIKSVLPINPLGRIFLNDTGTKLAFYTPSDSDPIRVWDLTTQRQIGSGPKLETQGIEARFSRDDKLVAFDLGRVLDLKTNRLLDQQFELPDSGVAHGMGGLEFSPDGSELAQLDGSSQLSFWSTRDLTLLAGPLQAHSTQNAGYNIIQEGSDLAYSPDGSLVATAGYDRTVRLTDARDHRLLGTVLGLHPNGVQSIAFTSDGRSLLTYDTAGELRSHPIAPDLVVADLCRRATHGLSRQDWKRLIPETPFSTTCPK
jgi:WD40 repeat protein